MKIHQISRFSLKIHHVIHHGLQRIPPREGKKDEINQNTPETLKKHECFE